MKKISTRQEAILQFIREKKLASNRDILEYVSGRFGETTRFTIIRDLDVLIEFGLIEKTGSGRSIAYEEIITSRLLRFIEVDDYLNVSPDDRIAKEGFDFSVFKNIGKLFNKQELRVLMNLNIEFQKRFSKISPATLKKEFERLTIEFSWKSSHIEGNTYNLVETEYLIKERKEAQGHSREEAIMILNHKSALDYIRSTPDKFKNISIKKIEDVHNLLIDGLGVEQGIRKGLVGITGTKYRPLDNEFQIRDALTAMCESINKQGDIFSKALLANAFIAYIQAFEDGNKRTSRMMGNAILIANGACPLSFRSIDEAEYKKAMIVFYEQNSLRYFKELFIEQYEFAVKTYFL